MRPGVAVAVLVSVVALGLGILATGRHLAGDDGVPTGATEPAIRGPVDQTPSKNGRIREPDAGTPAGQVAPSEAAPSSKDLAPAQTPTGVAGYQRIAPRAPLGDLGRAKSPAPQISGDWEGTNLFRPIANAAGVFEAMGYTVTVAGMDIVAPEETCVFQGEAWPCGALARTAFRSFLRGRAVTCALPAGQDQKNVAADCRVGDQNVGEWLVSNGWARAAKNGPYGDIGKKAQSAAKGIFGPPPEDIE